MVVDGVVITTFVVDILLEIAELSVCLIKEGFIDVFVNLSLSTEGMFDVRDFLVVFTNDSIFFGTGVVDIFFSTFSWNLFGTFRRAVIEYPFFFST
jgi:hypothetical protein